MRIYIIRHGEPDYAKDSLTEKGFREAALLATRMQALAPDAIYCSPLGRARDTARPTLASLGKEADILPWLQEFPARVPALDAEPPGPRIPWNLPPQYWTGQDALFSKDAWRAQPLMAAGDVDEQYRRVTEGLDALLCAHGYQRDGFLYRCEANGPGSIAFFCHFGLGMVLLAHLLGYSASLLWQTMFMPTSSVTTLITEERTKGEIAFKCMQLGDTSHLYAAGEPVSLSGLYPECYTGEEGSGPQ